MPPNSSNRYLFKRMSILVQELITDSFLLFDSYVHSNLFYTWRDSGLFTKTVVPVVTVATPVKLLPFLHGTWCSLQRQQWQEKPWKSWSVLKQWILEFRSRQKHFFSFLVGDCWNYFQPLFTHLLIHLLEITGATVGSGPPPAGE